MAKQKTDCERAAEDVLQAFVDTINNTGGIRYNANGCPEPAGDPNWIDLGCAYEKACLVLGCKAVIAE